MRRFKDDATEVVEYKRLGGKVAEPQYLSVLAGFRRQIVNERFVDARAALALPVMTQPWALDGRAVAACFEGCNRKRVPGGIMSHVLFIPFVFCELHTSPLRKHVHVNRRAYVTVLLVKHPNRLSAPTNRRQPLRGESLTLYLPPPTLPRSVSISTTTGTSYMHARSSPPNTKH